MTQWWITIPTRTFWFQTLQQIRKSTAKLLLYMPVLFPFCGMALDMVKDIGHHREKALHIPELVFLILPFLIWSSLWASHVALVVMNPAANAGDVRDMGSIHGLGRSPGVENGNPFQYSSLDNPMDRGAWRATVHGVPKSWTWLKQCSSRSSLYPLTLCFGDCNH